MVQSSRASSSLCHFARNGRQMVSFVETGVVECIEPVGRNARVVDMGWVVVEVGRCVGSQRVVGRLVGKMVRVVARSKSGVVAVARSQ